MKNRTKAQNKHLFALLNALGYDDEDRAELVSHFSCGRVVSSAELSQSEAEKLIKHLEGVKSGRIQQPMAEQASDRMRKKIIHYFHEMGWKNEEGKVDMKRVYAFIKKRGFLKKSFNHYTSRELPRLVSQVEIIYKKYLEKLIENGE